MAPLNPQAYSAVPGGTYMAELRDRRWLSPETCELDLTRPAGFDCRAGQRIRLIEAHGERDYTPASAPDAKVISLLVRRVPGGRVTPLLAEAAPGTRFRFQGPFGYFTYKPADRHSVFVATGTGVAPFCAMARSGVSGFTLLHGVSTPAELHYAAVLRGAAQRYVPCLSRLPAGAASPSEAFAGRVTDYLAERLPADAYDFYLCGRHEMIRDVTLLVDERFAGSRVFTEVFY